MILPLALVLPALADPVEVWTAAFTPDADVAGTGGWTNGYGSDPWYGSDYLRDSDVWRSR